MSMSQGRKQAYFVQDFERRFGRQSTIIKIAPLAKSRKCSQPLVN